MRVGYRCYWERGLQLLVGTFGKMLLPLQLFSQRETTIKMFIAYINLVSFGAFFIIVASIVVRQLFLQEIWKYLI